MGTLCIIKVEHRRVYSEVFLEEKKRCVIATILNLFSEDLFQLKNALIFLLSKFAEF
jgi:hypothetical protein